MKYACRAYGWSGDVLGDRMTEDGDVECCPACDGDDLALNAIGVMTLLRNSHANRHANRSAPEGARRVTY